MKTKTIGIEPLEDRIVVEVDEADDVTRGGIVLADTAKEKSQRGTVLAVGPGRLLDNGQIGDMSLDPGDRVLFARYGGVDVEIDGEEFKIMREPDVLGRIV